MSYKLFQGHLSTSPYSCVIFCYLQIRNYFFAVMMVVMGSLLVYASKCHRSILQHFKGFQGMSVLILLCPGIETIMETNDGVITLL